MTTTDHSKPLVRRREAAKKYLPERIKLLLVAEAPPCDDDRYFYFEDVKKHDWLFRYVWEGLEGTKPDAGQKPQCLSFLRDRGVYLIDLHEKNISKPTTKDLEPKVPGLIERCLSLHPVSIILIKHVVFDVSYEQLCDAGLPVVNAKLPFPASGQQKKFLESFRRAVKASEFPPKALI
jgi:hypothetical protein